VRDDSGLGEGEGEYITRSGGAQCGLFPIGLSVEYKKNGPQRTRSVTKDFVAGNEIRFRGNQKPGLIGLGFGGQKCQAASVLLMRLEIEETIAVLGAG
jgi:hypothetical protein